METWIALLRGINVGGRNRLSMESLRSIIASIGGQHAATYIQSGNAVFLAEIASRASFAADIAASIQQERGFSPAVRLITGNELDAAIRSNPFPDAAAEPTTLHLYFLDNRPDAARIARAENLASVTESCEVIGRCLYLHAPDGIGRSRLAKGLDRALGTNTTARNWRTVLNIAELAKTVKHRRPSDGIQ
ncbi:MAG: DUF1697 domain-containing protein [Woeseiaceae bacterium]|nr:DUF1697 domain-containing protein [Woeseiaceae bacterium]